MLMTHMLIKYGWNVDDKCWSNIDDTLMTHVDDKCWWSMLMTDVVDLAFDILWLWNLIARLCRSSCWCPTMAWIRRPMQGSSGVSWKKGHRGLHRRAVESVLSDGLMMALLALLWFIDGFFDGLLMGFTLYLQLLQIAAADVNKCRRRWEL